MSIEKGDLPARNRLEWAIDLVAQRVLLQAAEEIDWADYPELGEGDWERVCERVQELAPHPDMLHAVIAYEWLEIRANHADT